MDGSRWDIQFDRLCNCYREMRNLLVHQSDRGNQVIDESLVEIETTSTDVDKFPSAQNLSYQNSSMDSQLTLASQIEPLHYQPSEDRHLTSTPGRPSNQNQIFIEDKT